MSPLDPDTARLIDEEADHAEATREESYPPGAVAERRNRTRTTVYSVRLSDDEVSAIQRLAESVGVPSSTLVRSWIVEHLGERSMARRKLDPAVRDMIHSEVRAAVRDALDEVTRQTAA